MAKLFSSVFVAWVTAGRTHSEVNPPLHHRQPRRSPMRRALANSRRLPATACLSTV